MKNHLKYILFLVIVILSDCEKDGSSIEYKIIPSGNYSYQSYDSLDILIVNGLLQLKLLDSINIEGTWKFNRIKNSDNIGPQYGTGKLLGSISA
ncbi:MAG: hypothetical protein JXR46_12295 [Calditrichaceae bacterium]|nr:hypothetical protein [Calditrichaceae bacterium]MBN2709817.1 hypothetical protein [Calditrichaceae bacterium]